ncbi:MAG: hypothetical protein NC231_06355 [Bacillus sp. (in: Bacteria)]|nr:hypothetical protein [Bacillus sp. (in: firmicutes)]MCM1425236.1 hypothetical protein [Eubacterium sp.]
MRKIGRTKHHIKYISCIMALILGLLQPCAALAVEESETTVSDSDAEETANEKDTENNIVYITAFEPLAEEDSYFPCMYKPALEELAFIFPETLSVWIEGEESATEIEVTWESEEDFDETALEVYVFYPKWDESLYALAEASENEIEIPAITVEVPADSNMIHDLEEAQEALEDISENKSILALVYLCDEYEVKDTPGQGGETVCTVASGQSVQIVDAALDEYGAVWYQVILYQGEKEYKGYIEREYLATSDEDFAEWEDTYIDLSAVPMMMALDAGYPDIDQFPDSYQNALYSLKEKHPDWIFVRMDTGVDWNTAIAKEMGDKSLISSRNPASWQKGPCGQNGWSYASEGILKYYMDPRNFLTDPAIFQFEQLTYNKSYHTTDAVQGILKNSFMASTIPDDSQTYAQAFTAIGEKTGVSPFHLASRVLQEQGAQGTSPLISGNYSGYAGYYNYFNVGASGKSDEEVIGNGLTEAVKRGWNTRYKSLEGGAAVIGANYILRGQDTLYLEKFNVTNGFTHQYMQNIEAPNSEASNIRKAYYNAGALENSFVFKIPVYKNMPASACSKPNTTDSITLNKTSVSSLEVNKTVKLVPYVNGSKVDNVNNMTFTSNNTSVATVDSSGKVTAVSPGTATISCTRSGANTATCTVTVVKANPQVTTPTLSPVTYREGLKLSDISLPDGWKWVNGNTVVAVGTYSYEAVYTPSDTVKYNTLTKEVSFTVTKAIPECKMPEALEAQTGSVLGDIMLPDGFTWESNPEIELKEPGEYTFYVSYNPDEENYHAVNHLPVVVQVTGETLNSPADGDNVSSGSTSGGGTSGGNGDTSGNNSGTSGDNGDISGGNGSSGTSGTGTGTSTTSGGSSTSGTSTSMTSSGNSTSGSGNTSGTTSTSANTTSSASTSGGSNTSATSTSTTSSGSTAGISTGSTTSSSSTLGTSTGTTTSNGTTSVSSTSGGNDKLGTSMDSTSGSSISSGSSTTSSGSASGTNMGSTSSDSTSGSNNEPGTSTNTTSSKSTYVTSTAATPSNSTSTDNAPATSNDNTTQPDALNNNTSQSDTSNNNTTQPSDTGNSNTSNNNAGTNASESGSGAPLISIPENTTPTESRRKNTSVGSTLINPQTTVVDESGMQAQESGQEEAFFRPSVTIAMEDTTILTPEELQMAKEQNFNVVLDMGNYATWNIDIDAVDIDAMAATDMGITLGTKNIPTELIAAILSGNKYLEFTLAHDGVFGFRPVLCIALDPIHSGRYANLFYYNPETELLEFICDTIIDANGVATFDIEHASSYVIIVSDASMSGVLISDDSANHMTRWIVIGVLICMAAVIIGYGIFFYRKKMQEMEEDDEDEEEDGDEDEGEEEDEEENNDMDDTENDIVIEDIKIEDIKEADEQEKKESGEEDDWIEDKDWHEPETLKEPSKDRFADDHAEDDWIDDDEWNIENDWMDDAEWEKKNSRQ